MTNRKSLVVRSLLAVVGVAGLLIGGPTVSLAKPALTTLTTLADPVLVVKYLEAPSYAQMGEEIAVAATITNLGAGSDDPQTIEFRIDGKVVGSVELTFRARETVNLIFWYAFDEAGTHELEISTDSDSRLAEVTVVDEGGVCDGGVDCE